MYNDDGWWVDFERDVVEVLGIIGIGNYGLFVSCRLGKRFLLVGK